MTTGRAPAQRQIIDGPAGALEALVEDPGTSGIEDTSGAMYAVVCHPHPLFGGTMDNKVVTTVCRALHDINVATVRFNFRGVGASAGTFDGGIGETADAEAALHCAALRWPGRRQVFAGFSFGAYVAWRLAQTCRTSFLISIAPPVQRFEFTKLPQPDCPWLIVQGDADQVVDPAGVLKWAGGFTPPPKLVLMHDAGHFFHGRLGELRDAIRVAVREGFKDASRGSG